MNVVFVDECNIGIYELTVEVYDAWVPFGGVHEHVDGGAIFWCSRNRAA